MFTSNVFNRARSPPTKNDDNINFRSARSASPSEHNFNSSAHGSRSNLASPYLNGKKNNDYVAPHLSSNVVFYDHNYGYPNAMPNDRLLSPVKNDLQFRKQSTTSQDLRTPPKQEDPSANQRRGSGTQLLQPRRIEAQEYNQQEQVKRAQVRSPRNEVTSPRYSEQGDYQYQGRNNNSAQAGNIRDDRSEASTIVSNLSSAGYLCPKCLNRHMSGDKRTQCMIERHRDQENERNLASRNKRLQLDEEMRNQQERAKRAQETKNATDKLNRDYEARLEERRSPKKGDGGTTLGGIFKNEDEVLARQSELGSFFRKTLKDQMRRNEYDREMEKRNGQIPYNTSLRVGEGYSNKYIESPQQVLAKLKDQVEEKAYLQQLEKNLDQREAEARVQYAQKQLEEEERRRREKDYNQRRDLQEGLLRGALAKQQKQRDEMLGKQEERARLDQAYEDYKYKQKEQEAKTKRQLQEFKDDMLRNQKNTSYRQMYEERKLHKELTSFDPTRRNKKVYPCGECNGLYEKNYLTKYD